MKLRQISGIAAVATALVGCVATPPQHNYEPESRAISFPPLNEPQEVGIGEEMIREGALVSRDAIFVPRQMIVSMYTLAPGLYKKIGQTEAGEFFAPAGGPEGGQLVQQGIADPPQALVVRPPSKGGVLCVVTVFNFQACDRPQANVTFPSAEGFERRRLSQPASGTAQQALIYNGREGSHVRLQYRAAGAGVAAAPVTNQVDYDISVSPVIEYRGARIEVLDATSRSIRYRVLQHFRPAA